MKALGMVEVRGFLGAISVADAAVKAADVTLLKAEIIHGGLTTVEVIGDVAAVNAAVEVGVEVAKELNCLIAHHVISRVDAQTEIILSDLEPKKESQSEVKTEPQTDPISDLQTQTESKVTLPNTESESRVMPEPKDKSDAVPSVLETKASDKVPVVDAAQLKELQRKRVVDLRKQAYKMNLSTLKKSEIKLANKESLIQAIMAEIERSEDEWN
ncbi:MULTISPECIES: BMC domain-containing protein [Enterococcus]|uniref:BMC domain-containing protein n=1 Tax=Enterococcus TaxID=1350 RepID=UPI0010FF639D|nr:MULTISPECIES: BMC domain-containing protein [Enterococcus]MDT2684325.1 BMC domain-containing protein [Enterococcus gallinarum]QCT92123.1 BMC domain-containing protein [Enterococcus sp. M190262]GMG58985.1 BMC domain-containing protein [Enterococcus gallinarum]